jgi:hypothetical protein
VPQPTITLTPRPRTLSELLVELGSGDVIGTPAEFNCEAFLDAYAFLDMQLSANDPDFAPAAGLIDEIDDPMRIVRDEYCINSPTVFVSIPFRLFQNFRNDITALEESL